MSVTDEEMGFVKLEDLEDTDHSFSIKRDSTDDEYSVVFKKEAMSNQGDIAMTSQEEHVERVERQENIPMVIKNDHPAPRSIHELAAILTDTAVETNGIMSESTSPFEDNGVKLESRPSSPLEERTFVRHTGLTPEIQYLNITPSERVLHMAEIINLIFIHLDYKTLTTAIPLVCHQFDSIIEYAKEGNGPLSSTLFSEKYDTIPSSSSYYYPKQQQHRSSLFSSLLQYRFERPYTIELTDVEIHPAFEHMWIDLAICLQRDLSVEDIHLGSHKNKRTPLFTLDSIPFQNAVQPLVKKLQVHITIPYPGFYDIGGTAIKDETSTGGCSVLAVMSKFINVLNESDTTVGTRSMYSRLGSGCLGRLIL